MTGTDNPVGVDWHRPAGSTSRERDAVVITPEDAGWAYCGLRVVQLAPGEARQFSTGPDEVAVLPLTGGLRVETEGRSFRLAGRDSVFARVTDWAYVPVDAEVRLSSDAGVAVALASARATRRLDPARVDAEAVPVEVRGAGPATRQVTNFMAPDVFDGADKLMCVELLTPDGNWSSYPPHKHDGTDGCPVTNEEIYYFRVGSLRDTGFAPDGFALHRTYTTDGAVDVNVAVHDGDVFLIPRGYHGPCVAAPGHPLYYLNVLAGPGPERTMAFCDDPTHHWVRASWEGMAPDPRCPLTSAEGVVRP
ncbi:MAG TPA: 5-deoxy-glucuronate isomerase [Acidimicrobiales bacterium]|nr:5-deoxy-glucuronate isomerase [Acidimicrobiales bacterium]